MKTGQYKECLQCKTVIYVKPSRVSKVKYCSLLCVYASIRKTPTKLECRQCGREIFRVPSQVKWSTIRGYKNAYCAMSCLAKYYAMHPKPKTPKKRYIHECRTKAYVDWRTQVFVRDKYTCTICGARNGLGSKVVLHAHHLKKWSQYSELRFLASNGKTLCIDCHRALHQHFECTDKWYDGLVWANPKYIYAV